MKIFFSTIIIGICLVAAFVYLMDPGYRWRDAPAPFSRNLEPGEVRIFPTNFDERTVKASHLRFIGKPDVVLFGNSRVVQVNSSSFNPEFKVFNGGMSSATFEDYIAVWEILKEENKIPSRVILFIDPWQFNETSNLALTGWHNLEKYVDIFFSENKINKVAAITRQEKREIKTWRDKLKKSQNQMAKNFSDIAEFFSWPMVKASGLLLYKNGLSSDRLRNRIVKAQDLSPEDRGVLPDGATRYPETESGKKDPAELSRLAQDFISKPNYLDNWVSDQTATKKIQALFSDMAAHGIQMLVLTPPFHPLVEKLVSQRPDSTRTMTEGTAMLKAVLSANPNITFCDTQNSKTAGCDGTDMMDGTHMRLPCINKVMQYCLKGKVWGPLLNPSLR